FDASSLANQDGSSVSTSGIWFGTGQDNTSSYLGLYFSGQNIPKNAKIDSANLQIINNSGDQWISTNVEMRADTDSNPAGFSSKKLSERSLTSASKSFKENTKWTNGETYSYDVKDLIQELVNSND